MKRFALLFAAAGLLALPASAQLKVTTKAVCQQRCNEGSPDQDIPKLRPYNEKLAQVRQQLKTETDPGKRKALDELEQELIDDRADAIEKICRHICASNPEG